MNNIDSRTMGFMKVRHSIQWMNPTPREFGAIEIVLAHQLSYARVPGADMNLLSRLLGEFD